MIRYFIVLLLFNSFLLGCTLCSVYSPKTHYTVNIKSDKEFIKSAEIEWVFGELFTEELKKLYDINLDNTFDKKELALIEEALLSYIEPKNYLTFISYDTKINEESRKVKIIKKEFTFKNGLLSFYYKFDLNYKIKDKYKLYVEVYDEEGYFIMIADLKKQLLHIPYKIKKELEANSVTFTIDAPNLKPLSEKELLEEEQVVIKSKENLIENSIENTPSKKDNTLLNSFVTKVKTYLVEIEKGEDKWALLFLLFASFIYGIIHAIGPGHGKALAFSYFSSMKSSYFQALLISFSTAFIHILGAFILVVISVFILQTILSSFLDDSIKYISMISAVLIMFLSMFILYRKILKKSCACSACDSEDKPMFTIYTKNINYVKTTSNKIHFSNTRKKEDLFFVLTAGLIPCPGTVVLFVYAFILETYFSVILASIAISLGMGLVIFASSFLGVTLNKVSHKQKKLINIVEFTAPIIMFILGMILFFNANNL